MSQRSSRRLAGCIAIELALAAGVAAADFEYKAGTATYGQAKALALEDRRGNRAAIAEAEFAVPRAVSDSAGMQLMRDYGLSREGLVVRGAGSDAGRADDLVTAVLAAFGKLEPATIRFAAGVLSITDGDDRCRAAVSAGVPLRFDGCAGGDLVRSPLRAAFQMVEPPHGLEQRGQLPPAYPVQAIALGKQAAILALGGEVAPGRFAQPRLIVLPFSNDTAPLPDDAQVEKTIRSVLSRVGHSVPKR